jgi:DNA-binding XRE family transcriptional regulator
VATEIVGVARKKCYHPCMFTPQQSRAARGWLDWSQEDLAKLARVSLSTVRDFEKGKRIPIPNNLDAMCRAFEAHGIRPLVDGERDAGIAVANPKASGAQAVTMAGSGMLPGNDSPS